MRLNLLVAGLILLLAAQVVFGQAVSGLALDAPKAQAPIYFLSGHHQESVGSAVKDFPNFGQFKRDLQCESARQEAAGQTSQTKTNLDWTNKLQLWTLEPVALRNQMVKP